MLAYFKYILNMLEAYLSKKKKEPQVINLLSDDEDNIPPSSPLISIHKNNLYLKE